MKIVAINPNYVVSQNKDVNFGATAILGKDIGFFRDSCPKAVELTDPSLYQDLWKGFRELITNAVEAMQKGFLRNSETPINPAKLEDSTPHIFLFEEDKPILLGVLKEADDEIARETTTSSIRETFMQNCQKRKGACGVLRSVIEQLLALPYQAQSL